MDRGQGGFTLMETIVALVVFSSVFVAMYQAMAGGSRSLRHANLDAAATTLALSRMASAGIETALKDGQEFSGTEDPFWWRVSVQRRADDFDDVAPLPKVAAFWVNVEVNWREGTLQTIRTIKFKTLKLGARS
jgi:prepilin-type N-terminal cleavage/methylation domain-containing protein